LIIILIIIIGGGGTAGYIFRADIMAMINGTEEVADHEEDSDENSEESSDENSDESSEEVVDYTADNTAEDYTEEEVTEDETTEEEIVEEEVVEEEVVEEPIVDNSSSGGNYHVIGNAFQDASNADKYVSDMKSQGYSSAKVLGKFDGLHMVSVKQFDSRSGASSSASQVGGGAWVFKYPK